MSQTEIDRLIRDVTGNPAMLAEAMGLKDRAALEAYIIDKGYDLNEEEMEEVWTMANKFMAGAN